MPLTNYIKTAWVNGGTPAINSTNLNKIETQLYDLTEEAITPAFSSDTTATQSVITLSSSVVNGEMNGILKGNTEINIVQNANFTSTNNWVASASTLTVSNNIISTTGDGTNASVFVYQNLYDNATYWNSKKIFIRAMVRVTNSSCQSIQLGTYPSTSGTSTNITQNTPLINQWYLLQGLITVPSDNSGNIRLRAIHNYVDSTTANAKVLQVKEIMVIDLTARYGAGNEISEANAILKYNNFFNDVMSTNKVIVKSIGKNLVKNGTGKNGFNNIRVTAFDNTEVTGICYVDGDGYNLTATSNGRGIESDFIQVATNQAYTLSANFTKLVGASPSYRFNILVYDNDFNLLSRDGLINSITYNATYQGYLTNTYATDGTKTLNVTVNNSIVKYIKVKAMIYLYTDTSQAKIKNIQFEQGATATTYEEYVETQGYMTDELKSVNTSITDTFDINTGTIIKNVSSLLSLTGNEYTWSFSADNTGNKRVQANNILTNKAGVLNTSLVLKNTLKQLTYDASGTSGDSFIDYANGNLALCVLDTDTGWDEAWVSGTSFTGMTWANLIKAYMNGWKMTTTNTNVASCVWTGITSGTTKSGASGYTDVTTTIDTGYTPYRILYKLENPTINQYYNNIINAKPSGNLNIYASINDFDFYNAKCTINNTNYPILFLEFVNIINRTNGNLTPVKISTCTIASDGLSFTSTAIAQNDLVDFGYTFKNKTTLPTINYNYAQSLKGQVNSNSEQIEKLDEKTVQLEEQINVIKSSIPIYLSELELTADTAQVNFTIPSGFSKIEYECHNIMTTTASDTEFTIILNDDTTSGNYLTRSYRSDGTNNTTYYNADAGFITHSVDGIVGQSTFPGYIEGNITNIQTQSKKIRQTANDYNVDRSEILIGVWTNTSSEINKLSFKNVSGNIKAGALFKIFCRK